MHSVQKPSYLNLYEDGRLKERLKALEARLEQCDLCPHQCNINRFRESSGCCFGGYRPYISSVCDHHGEEPPISGFQGSGTVFFGSCNLRCVYCQNHDISQNRTYFENRSADFRTAAERIVELQESKGVHNINFVSPTHFVPQMVRIIYEAIPLGLRVPIVYNCNGYEDIYTLRQLDGIVDIYLPDFKYFNDHYGRKYSAARGYVSVAKAAIKEMYRQVGPLKTDRRGVAYRGLLVRHLILPNEISGSQELVRWLAETFNSDIDISLMSQYYPAHYAPEIAMLSRSIRYGEYRTVVSLMEELRLNRRYTQAMSAPPHYLPDFKDGEHPFLD